MRLGLAPSGRVIFDPAATEEPAPSPRAAERITRAFAAGPGPGILHLGAVEVTTPLPPSLAWFQRLGRRFMTALCAVEDLDAVRGTVEIPPPDDALREMLRGAPPMWGGQHLDLERARPIWALVQAAARDALARHEGPAEGWLQRQNRLWHAVGRICLHLAENRRDPAHPFAFLATYAHRVSDAGRVQHLPLGRALRDSAEAGDRARLLTLLQPVQRAAAESPLLDGLVRSNGIYHPQRWTAEQALAFLREVPRLEANGLVVRVPDWWKARPRPRVRVTVGDQGPARLGAEALLDFSADVVLGDEPLSEDELAALLAGQDGLVLLKGEWVEVDRASLGAVLDHWQAARDVAAGEGLSFIEAMRLLAGARVGAEASADPAVAEWTAVRAGGWLAEQLAALRDPSRAGAPLPGDALRATLRPYQADGVRWLSLLTRLGLGACLADDMGLGKTMQVLGLLLLERQRGAAEPSLLVVPTSLMANWRAEMSRFAPDLRVCVLHPSEAPLSESDGNYDAVIDGIDGIDVAITSYGMLRRLPALAERRWNLVALDEAQAIKNPGAQQTRAAKALRARARIALTGTPVENRAADLWSLFDFINPGLLGTRADFTRFTRQMGDHFGPLRALTGPYILRRLKTDRRIIADLPDKTEVKAWCALSRAQAALYADAVAELSRRLDTAEGIERRGLVLAFMTRFKQICNHPSHWLGDDRFAPADSGKFTRLAALAEQIAEGQQKVLVFTQFTRIIDPLMQVLHAAFGRPGLRLDGGTPVAERARRVAAFQDEEGPPYFVLSLKAGGTGLNLTAASHVIHFDRWWNPAVEDQATDRAYRIGQRRNVLVHKFVCRGTLEERLDAMLEEKSRLSEDILGGGGELPLTELPDDELLRLIALDVHHAMAEE